MIVFLLGKAKEAQDMNRPEKNFPSHSIFQYLTKASDRVSFKYSILLIRRTEWAALEFRNPIPPRLHCVNVSSETQNHLNENSFAVHNHCAPDTARLISHAMFLMCQFGEVPFYFISRFDVSWQTEIMKRYRELCTLQRMSKYTKYGQLKHVLDEIWRSTNTMTWQRRVLCEHLWLSGMSFVRKLVWRFISWSIVPLVLPSYLHPAHALSLTEYQTCPSTPKSESSICPLRVRLTPQKRGLDCRFCLRLGTHQYHAVYSFVFLPTSLSTQWSRLLCRRFNA